MESFSFGNLLDGRKVTAYRLSNHTGTQAVVLDYGCTVQSLSIPNRTGGTTDVVLGYDTAEEYEKNDGFFGAAIGRVGNRIRESRFVLDGKTYQLTANEGKNHLHGGVKGFDRQLWDAVAENNKVVFSRISPDGEEGYPGTLSVQITYELLDGNALKITYKAETDQATPVSLTNHCCFNLDGKGNILNHTLQLNADYFTKINDQLLPTGTLQSVEGSPMDFRQGKAIGKDIKAADQQLLLAGGYDHNYVLNSGDPAARLIGPETGIVMTVYTTEPGVQVYSGNSITPRKGKNGTLLNKNSGICLETQNFPDAVNQNHFPNPILRPGQVYYSETLHVFESI